VIRGSARRALETTPPFTHLRFFELAGRAADLKAALEAEYPNSRDRFKIVPGDCNATINATLAELADLNWAPTFAFLDQQSTEVQWSTLQRLARHKPEGRPKTELWLLCASGLLPRGLRLRTEAIDTTVGRMSGMFGTDEWTEGSGPRGRARSAVRRHPQRVAKIEIVHPPNQRNCTPLFWLT
jgi:three-Cys-motif partner protein